MNDIYAAPASTLTDPAGVGQYGSLERGIAGDYPLAIGDVLSEAWAKTRGAKWTIHLALGLYFAVLMAVMFALGLAIAGTLTSMEPGSNILPSALIGLVQQLVLIFISVPMGAGLFLIALRRSVDAPIGATTVFATFHKIVPLTLVTLLMYLLIGIGLLLLVLPGIYLAVAYYFAVPLIVEKNLGPWQALEASRKAVSKRWFTVLGLGMVIALINVAALFTLGIGWIWTVPMSLIAYGIVYRNMFGCEAATVANP